MGTSISGIAIKTDVHKFDSEDIIKHLLSPNYQEFKEEDFSNSWYSDSKKSCVIVYKTKEAVWLTSNYMFAEIFFSKEKRPIYEQFNAFFGGNTLIIGFQHFSFSSTYGYSIIKNGEIIRCRISGFEEGYNLEFGEPYGVEAKWFETPISIKDYKGNIEEDYDGNTIAALCSLNADLTACAMDDILLEEVGLSEDSSINEAFEIRYFVLYDEPVKPTKVEKAFWISKIPNKDEYLQRQKELYANYKYDFKKINDEYFNQSTISSLWRDNEVFAIHALFIEKDLKKAKQHFYKCSRLHEYSLKRFGKGAWRHDNIVLLSDNRKVIKNYTRVLDSAEQKIIKTKGSWIYAQQCIIKGDYEAYKNVIDVIKMNRFNIGVFNQKTIAFCDALMEENLPKMESILAAFTTSKFHKYSNKYNPFRDYLSYTALKYAKLAWYKGFQVQVDSPLVPYELLPINPLQDDEYEDYDFVKKYLG